MLSRVSMKSSDSKERQKRSNSVGKADMNTSEENAEILNGQYNFIYL